MRRDVYPSLLRLPDTCQNRSAINAECSSNMQSFLNAPTYVLSIDTTSTSNGVPRCFFPSFETFPTAVSPSNREKIALPKHVIISDSFLTQLYSIGVHTHTHTHVHTYIHTYEQFIAYQRRRPITNEFLYETNV